MDKDRPVRLPVDSAQFRRVLGHVPTTVTVVTATTPNGPAGLVVGAFVSISLDPPLVGIFIDKKSSSGPAIWHGETFAVNVLAHDQQELCARFAKSGAEDGDKFSGLVWSTTPQGNPLLAEVTAWIDCLVQEVQRLGDHYFIVAQVAGLDVANGAAPLIFHRGSLHTLTSHLESVS